MMKRTSKQELKLNRVALAKANGHGEDVSARLSTEEQKAVREAHQAVMQAKVALADIEIERSRLDVMRARALQEYAQRAKALHDKVRAAAAARGIPADKHCNLDVDTMTITAG
jgi:hypothetical protein